MRCQICGKEIDSFYVVDSDGVEKIVAYCDECKKRVLNEALPVDERGLTLMVAHANLVQDSAISSKVSPSGGRYEIFVRMPVVVLSVLFREDEGSEDRRRKELYLREVTLLQKRLEKAVENENYREASRLKRKIQQIKRILEKKS